jgi:DNA polymerase I-like protein with 3'-5' exonuclease and polymerase domains
MHDALECSLTSLEQAQHIQQLGREAVSLTVPMLIDAQFGRSWGDAKHTWEEIK